MIVSQTDKVPEFLNFVARSVLLCDANGCCMFKNSLSRIIWMYVSMITGAVACLIFWVLYVLDAYQTINSLVARMGGGTGGYYHWIVLAIGCVLLVFLIVGLSLQMASNISNYRYNRKQQEFVSNITHELKSPLAAIKLHGQTLQQVDLNKEEQAKFVNHILQQADRMALLVEDVLEISRIKAKAVSLRLEPLDLSEFFKDYFVELRAGLANEKVRIQDDINTQSRIMGNSLALHRILDNLINNAIKASKEGDAIGCVVSDKGKTVEIEVWDKGVGISKTELRRIFERFYQIGAEIRGRRKGTGLGLAIVKGLVKEMKGNIRVESQGESRGARFFVSFPIL